jgi:hypothetical protein
MAEYLERACELLWQAGHPAIAEALAAEVADLVAAAGREQRLRDALTRIVANAEAWHGPLADTGHERALAVIAQWGRAVLEEGQQP